MSIINRELPTMIINSKIMNTTIIIGNIWCTISLEPRALTKADKRIHYISKHTHTHTHTHKHSSDGFGGNRRK